MTLNWFDFWFRSTFPSDGMQINGFPNRKNCSQWISQGVSCYNYSPIRGKKQPLTPICNLVKGVSIGPRFEIVIGIWAALMSPPFFILHPFIWAVFFISKQYFFPISMSLLLSCYYLWFSSPLTAFSTRLLLILNQHLLASSFSCVSNLIKLRMLHRPCIYLLASFHCHSPLFQICLLLSVILSIFQFGTAFPAAPCLVYSARASCDVPPFNQTPFSSIKTLSQA